MYTQSHIDGLVIDNNFKCKYFLEKGNFDFKMFEQI